MFVFCDSRYMFHVSICHFSLCFLLRALCFIPSRFSDSAVLYFTLSSYLLAYVLSPTHISPRPFQTLSIYISRTCTRYPRTNITWSHSYSSEVPLNARCRALVLLAYTTLRSQQNWSFISPLPPSTVPTLPTSSRTSRVSASSRVSRVCPAHHRAFPVLPAFPDRPITSCISCTSLSLLVPGAWCLVPDLPRRFPWPDHVLFT